MESAAATVKWRLAGTAVGNTRASLAENLPGAARMHKNAEGRSDSGMEHFGYRESLDRGIGKFGSFAAGVSYISILTGTFQLFYFGFGTAGPAYLWSWPMVLVGQLAVGLCFMELSAKYPVAGSVYNWSKQLGSRIVGWSAGWLMLTASIVTLSAVVLALQLNLPRCGAVSRSLATARDRTTSPPTR